MDHTRHDRRSSWLKARSEGWLACRRASGLGFRVYWPASVKMIAGRRVARLKSSSKKGLLAGTSVRAEKGLEGFDVENLSVCA